LAKNGTCERASEKGKEKILVEERPPQPIFHSDVVLLRLRARRVATHPTQRVCWAVFVLEEKEFFCSWPVCKKRSGIERHFPFRRKIPKKKFARKICTLTTPLVQGKNRAGTLLADTRTTKKKKKKRGGERRVDADFCWARALATRQENGFRGLDFTDNCLPGSRHFWK